MKADPRTAAPANAALSGPAQPRDRRSLRRTNLGVVLRILRDAGPRSRAQLAGDTGLPKPTITNLVAELVTLGLVSEGPAQREGAVGRPGTLVHLDGRDICGIGVEISTSDVYVLALSLTGDIAYEHRSPVDVARAGTDAVLDRTARSVQACLSGLEQDGKRPIGLTLAVPGVVDPSLGVVAYAPALGWRNVPVAEELLARLEPAPPRLTAENVAVENDAKAGAMAEYVRVQDMAGQDGTGRDLGVGVHDMVCITGERGIGAGIISDGRLLRGRSGFAGEVGHMPLGPRGSGGPLGPLGSEPRVCVCGRYGCWETLVGLDAILRLAADDGDEIHDPSVELETRLAELHRRADDGDPRTLEALDRVADDLGLGIAVLADVLNPGVVVLGGYFTHIGDLMLDRVRHVVRDRVMAPDAGGCEVLLSTLGFTAAARGGAYLALDAVYQDPSAV
ncbi:ROK family transcriptional regulator [Streptomyces sp. NPDC026092]|uniref:ROK family transcriptional regulator n=1 Tax=Streptomyces sp. NPDC026092 TaxID=3154797 RepID=UPI0033DD0CED